MLAKRTGSIYSQPHPSNAGTKHLVRQMFDPSLPFPAVAESYSKDAKTKTVGV
jgi:hypothetical protein